LESTIGSDTERKKAKSITRTMAANTLRLEKISERLQLTAPGTAEIQDPN